MLVRPASLILVVPPDGQRARGSKWSSFGQRLYKLALFVALFPVFDSLSRKTLKAKEKEKDEMISDQSRPAISRRRQFNFIADVVEQVLPSIVSIEIKEKLNVFHGFHSLGHSSDQAVITSGSGSGFVIDGESGLILTNAHVVRNYSSLLNVKLKDGRSFKGRVVKIDRASDLAIVKIDCVSHSRRLIRARGVDFR